MKHSKSQRANDIASSLVNQLNGIVSGVYRILHKGEPSAKVSVADIKAQLDPAQLKVIEQVIALVLSPEEIAELEKQLSAASSDQPPPQQRRNRRQ